MLSPENLPQLQTILFEQNLDAWLLFDFRGRNLVPDAAHEALRDLVRVREAAIRDQTRAAIDSPRSC